MAETPTVETAERSGNKGTEKDLDDRIEQARKMKQAMSQHRTGADSGDEPVEAEAKVDKGSPTSPSPTQPERTDADKLTVNREYIHGLREEAKESRIEKDNIRKEMADMQKILSEYFHVDNPQALKEKLEEEKRGRSLEEESKLSKVDLAVKRAKEAERQLEEAKIQSEQERKALTEQRDKIIIQNSLIQAAVANDVANPKQLLKLLEHEFFVDPDRLVPFYKAEDGSMSLEERVEVFLNEDENWNLVASKIQGGSGTKGSKNTISGKRVFTKTELADMRSNHPNEYKRLQPEIMAAYRENRVHG